MATEAENPASSNEHIRKDSNGSSTRAGLSKEKRFKLADLLRECAALVEQNEFEQKTFQAMFRDMTAYVQSQGGKVTAEHHPSSPSEEATATSAASSAAAAPTARPPAADPPGVSTARKVTTTTTRHYPPPPGSTSSRAEKREESTLSNQNKFNFVGKLKSTMKEVGQEFTNIAHTGQRGHSNAAKHATSTKNAERVKRDIASQLGDEFSNLDRSETRSETSHNPAAATPRPPNPNRPPFQRPVNPNSTLISNGWMEQQRRSRMRPVWKEVLVSLVAGRKPGEETTLWVQREIPGANGKTELEALHQIPIKGMQDVNYVDFSTDHRFVIQVYNLSDEFIFRTRDNAEAAKNWVSTLRLTRDAVLNGVPPPRGVDLNTASNRTKNYPGHDDYDEKKADSPPSHTYHQEHSQPRTTRKLSVQDMRAIAHGHGYNTHGMEKGELESLVARIQQQNIPGHPTPHPPSGPPPESAQTQAPHPPTGPPPPSQARRSSDGSAPEDEQRRYQEEESRREAERLQREEQQRETERRARMKMDEEAAAKLAAKERERAESERRRAEAEARHDMEAERNKRYQQAEEQRRKQAAYEQQRKQWEEEQRKKQWGEAQRRKQWEEEQRRRAYYQQQQQQHPPGSYQQRPPPGGYPQPPQGDPHPQQPRPPPQQGQQQHPQHPQWNQQQPPPRQQTPPPGHGGHPQTQPRAQRPGPGPAPPPSASAAGSSPINQKWSTMATEESTGASISTIKHNILISWALQPPTLQMLRPLADLLTTVHTVFPPSNGVPGHEYFAKWKSYSMTDISENGRPTEVKMAKAVKKLRFFLHPDKLPRDLSDEQAFICKMVWDIISDANEEYQKRKEDLDWLNPSSSS